MIAILGLGSNVPEGDKKIEQAVDALISKNCQILCRSGIYIVSEPYFNEAVSIETDMDCACLSAMCKEIELGMGRDQKARAEGRVPIDMDVVIFDGKIIRQRDYDQSYFQEGYKVIFKEKGL